MLLLAFVFTWRAAIFCFKNRGEIIWCRETHHIGYFGYRIPFIH